MPITPVVQQHIDAWNEASASFGPLLQGKPGDWAVEREKYVNVLAQHPTPDGVTITQADMGGIAATVVTPGCVEDGRILLYIHGGGYIAGSPAAYHGLAGHYARLLKAVVYMPDYRLAPEHPFPAAIVDTLASYKWLLDQGHSPKSIAFSGDSAGGAMVVSVMVAARNAGLALPAAGVAISPWANLEHSGSSMMTRDGIDPTVSLTGLNLMANAFLNGALKNNPEASPVFADVRGLPPILVQIGESEVMLSDAMRLAMHLAENRVRVSLEVWPGMFHVWHMFAAILTEGMEALKGAATFLEGALRADVDPQR
ncbi:alpha/beta hydrolase [Phyllobacterium myrsinacearum]|uniref:Acetyl esterase/lipase n=1 Tax=Phyllobacterium myrsinacearum TaxID=28101 RepID=A0A839EHN4_9HYPH|nr:alpha/beta hydrolase [Phyllobacterium myrsinacearum]MBA8878299.1 acetyl esterase/lipase [Phyllobacterium myrsinacearum]